jgi:hypothetical protein
MEENIKFYMANAAAIIVSFSQVEQILQILVLATTLVYTITKAVKAIRDFKK